MTTETTIAAAARFLASTPHEARPAPLIPALKSMFALSTREAVVAIQQSQSRGDPARITITISTEAPA